MRGLLSCWLASASSWRPPIPPPPFFFTNVIYDNSEAGKGTGGESQRRRTKQEIEHKVGKTKDKAAARANLPA